MTKAGVKIADVIKRKQEEVSMRPAKPAPTPTRLVDMKNAPDTTRTKQPRNRSVQKPPAGSTPAPNGLPSMPIHAENGRGCMFLHLDAQSVADPKKLLDFVRWSAIPVEVRTPRTQREFASQIGIDETTLGRWKWLPNFWDEVSLYRDRVVRRHTSDVVYAIIKAAKNGNVQAQKLFMELFENHVPKLHVATSPDGFETDEEREQFMRAAALSGRAIAEASDVKFTEAFLAASEEVKE